jgi:DnaJ like chaperone protein
MDLRQFFSSNTWWGKSIGAFFGFLMAGPVGALFGLLIGNFFDKGLNQHYTQPCWHYRNESDEVKEIFRHTLFAVLGHLAKLDGYVSAQAIHMAKTNMQQLGLSSLEQKEAREYFNYGKSPKFNLSAELGKLYSKTHTNTQLLRLFVDLLYTNVRYDGISVKKLHTLNTILRALHFAPIYEQNNFSDYFAQFKQEQFRSQQNQSSHQHTQHTTQSGIEYAFMILRVSPSANKTEVKRAYRKLMSQHHPDKLIAQGLPEYKIKEANAMTQKISKAYEEILKYKGW